MVQLRVLTVGARLINSQQTKELLLKRMLMSKAAVASHRCREQGMHLGLGDSHDAIEEQGVKGTLAASF